MDVNETKEVAKEDSEISQETAQAALDSIDSFFACQDVPERFKQYLAGLLDINGLEYPVNNQGG